VPSLTAVAFRVAEKEYAPQAMEALVKIATTGKSDSARVAASIAILDRAFGRPRQMLQAQSSNVQYFITDQLSLCGRSNHFRREPGRVVARDARELIGQG
jgi:hypothetical protein